MNRIRLLILALITTISLSACDNVKPTKQDSGELNPETRTIVNASENKNNPVLAEPEKKLPETSFNTVDWIDLMPEDDLDALLNPPSYITDIEDGSLEDQIASQVQNTIAAASDDRYQQALVSTRVVPEMAGQAIRIPGFVVPIEFSDEQTVTQFFLVPFFGACIHVPPPPPNQVIFVNYPEGLKLESLYDPFWISGILQTSLIENEIAKATYSVNLQYFEKYSE